MTLTDFAGESYFCTMLNFAGKEVMVAGQTLLLCNQRVAYWEEMKMLMLSDLHVGKGAHFRKHGIALPQALLEKDLERLQSLISYLAPKEIVIVGDLLHAGSNSEVDRFCDWRSSFSHIDFHLVEGNHDRISAALERKLCLTSKNKMLHIGSIVFNHNFDNTITDFQITGHIHPGAVLRNGVKNIKLPCFSVTQRQLLLPAFSEFTGLDVKSAPAGRKFIFTQKEIYEI